MPPFDAIDDELFADMGLQDQDDQDYEDDDEAGGDNGYVDVFAETDEDDEEEDDVRRPRKSAKAGKGRKADQAPVADSELSSILTQDMRFRQEEAQYRRQQQQQEAEQRRQQRQQEAEQQRRDRVKSAVTSLVPETEAVSLTPEEEALYAKSRGVIDKIAQSRLAAYARDRLAPAITPLMEQIEQQNQAIEELRAASTQRTASELDLRITARVPNVHALTQHAQFGTFRNTEIPGLNGITYGRLLQDAYSRGDVDSVAGVMSAFAKATAAKSQGKPRSAVPGSVQSAPVTRAPKGRKLRMSDLDRASQQLRAGLITRARYDKIADQFDVADAKGLVDYNA